MKKIIYSLLLMSCLVWMVACDGVNSMHDKYLANGEDFLVGKFDSIHAYGGDQRVKLVVWNTDFRATKFVISRMDTSLIYKFDLNPVNRKDSMVYYVDRLKEGTNVLQLLTWNADSTVHSIAMSRTVTTWGAKYKRFLKQRPLTSYRFNMLTKLFTLTWDGNNVVEPVMGRYSIGHEVKYTTTLGRDTLIREFYSPNLITKTDLPKFPTTGGKFGYRMMYLPATTCIDTFRTEYTEITMP